MKTIKLSIKILVLLFIVGCSSFKKTPLTEEEKVKQFFKTELEAYTKDYTSKGWAAMTDKMYPKIFNRISKEKIIENYKSMEERGVKMTYEIPTIKSVSEKIIQGEEQFYSIDYYQKITLKFSGKMLTGNVLTKKSVETSFGKENVTFDEKTETYYINATKSILAISPIISNDWKYIEYDKQNARMLKSIIPDEVLDKISPKKNPFIKKEKIETLKEVGIVTLEESIEEESAPTVERIFSNPERMAQFPGGDAKLFEYIIKNLNYPEQAKKNNVKGRVYIQFFVEKDGGISHVKALRGIGSGCDEEAIRVVKSMPNWIPGEQGGEKVRVRFNLPINFNLR